MNPKSTRLCPVCDETITVEGLLIHLEHYHEFEMEARKTNPNDPVVLAIEAAVFDRKREMDGAEVVRTLARIQKHSPCLRVGQIVSGALTERDDLFNIENDRLLLKLMAFEQKILG